MRKRTEPQLTLLGLVLGSFVSLVIFFNVTVVHDYYALTFLPIYCALVSIGILYFYSYIGLPFSSYPRTYKALVAVALLVSIYYAYSLRLLNYNGNNGSVQTGKSLQQLIPDDGYLFYFHGADYIDPEYLYYARRRGVLYDLIKAENGLIGQTIKDHKWDPGKTYLLALGFRVRPDWQEKLKQKLDQYDLKEIGTSYDDGVVYKITPRS